MRLSLLVLLLTLSASVVAAPRRPTCASTYPADVIGYVTWQQIRSATGEGLPVGALHARQRQKLPSTSRETRIKFFKKGKGRYGILLMASPQVEELKR